MRLSIGIRWPMGVLVCWCLWANHYSRDLPGALEREIEADVGISKADYQGLNSVYFLPNLVAPLVSGFLSQRFGSENMLIALCGLFALGNVLVACGGAALDYSLLVGGRICTGLTYESIDMSPLPILSPLFTDCWGFMCGVFNAFLRGGSVVNFLVSPKMYHIGGLSAATAVSAVISLTTLVASIAAKPLRRKAVAVQDARSTGLLQGHLPVEAEQAPLPLSSMGQVLASLKGLCLKEFWLFTLMGAVMYAGLVPFWFYGGGFIRNKWGYSLDAADAMVLMCEGGIMVLAPFLGGATDTLARETQLKLFTAVSVLVPFSYVLMAYVPVAVPPIVPMLCLGASIGTVNAIYWCLSGFLVPEEHEALGAGILGSALNLGSTVVPLIMARVPTDTLAILLLAFFSSLVTFIGILLCRLQRHASPGGAPSMPHDPSGVSLPDVSA